MYLSRLLSKILCWLKTNWFITRIEKQNANELDHYLYFCSKKRYFPYVWICLQMLYPMFTFLSQQSFHICCLDFFNEVIHSVNARIDLKSSWNFFETFLCCNTLLAPHLPTHTVLRKRGFLVNGNVYSSLYEESNYPYIYTPNQTIPHHMLLKWTIRFF